MNKAIEPVRNPTDEEKERARQFREALLDVLDPLLMEGGLTQGRAPSGAVEALIRIQKSGGPGGLPWNNKHPLWIEHSSLSIWQATSLDSVQKVGGKFADRAQWLPNVDTYVFAAGNLNELDALHVRVKMLCAQLAGT